MLDGEIQCTMWPLNTWLRLDRHLYVYSEKHVTDHMNSYHEPLWTWKNIYLMFKGLNPVVKCMFLWVCLCVPSTLISFLTELPPPSQTLSGRVGLIVCGWVTAYLSISTFIYSFLTSMPITIYLVNVYVCKKRKRQNRRYLNGNVCVLI